MSFAQKGDRTLIKEINQNIVLQLIQGRGPISRKEVAQVSGLSPAAVSGITAELIEQGLVQEVGETENEGRAGRRAILLRLNPHAGFVVGVKLGVREIRCGLTDLDANVLHATDTALPAVALPDQLQVPFAPQDMINATIETVEKLLATTSIDRARLLGIGVGINGVVDTEGGISRLAPHYGWRNVPFAGPIAAHFALPVYLENDIRTLTIAEQWFGAGREVDHFAAVGVGYGIGSGVVINRQLYRGAVGGAGEFGHTVLQPDGPPCTCGKRGCLDSLAAVPAVLRKVKLALEAGAPSMLTGRQPLTLEAVAAAAEAGDSLAQRVLADAGRWLGVGLASLVNILNPQMLIIKGEAVRFGRWYFEPMEDALRAHSFDGLAGSLRILAKPDGNESWARGAACVVLSALFTSPVHKENTPAARAASPLMLS